MIDVETLARLKTMRLSGMAEYFENLAGTTGKNPTLTGPEMVKMAVDWEYERRRDSKLARLRKRADLAEELRAVFAGEHAAGVGHRSELIVDGDADARFAEVETDDASFG